MKFIVEGEMEFKSETRKFSKVVEAPNEKLAREYTYNLIGSNHRLKRTKIRIINIKKEA